MRPERQQRAARIALPFYLLSIYSTLGVMRTVTNFLRDRELLRITVGSAFALVALAVCALVLSSKPLRSLKVGIALIVTGIAYAAIIWPMESPEEKLHFIEYGIVALLAERAAPARLRGVVRFVSVAAFVLAAGWLDEGIQGLIPSRHYDLRDVGFNLTAGLVALCALSAIRWLSRAPAPPAPQSARAA